MILADLPALPRFVTGLGTLDAYRCFLSWSRGPGDGGPADT